MVRRTWSCSAGAIVGLLAAAQALVACNATRADVYADLFEAEGTTTDGPAHATPARAGAHQDTDDVDDEAGGSQDDGGPDGDDGVTPNLDVGGPPGDDQGPTACQAVDLLFVIDDSGSMGDEQLNLVASFPGFIDGIGNRLGPATSYHVGVVTTDAYEWNVPQCRAVGGLTVRTGGALSSDEMCGPYASGGNYMTIADDLTATFSCAAQVGIDGAGIERPMDALAAALMDPAGATSTCNAGFLRDDALLVVVVITDEEDDGDSIGNPVDWYQTVLDAKGGDASDVVVLSLLGHPKPNACIATQWTGMMGAELSPRLITFTQLFEHGLVGDVCAPDYTPFFAAAVDGIADACGIVPTPAG